METATSPRQFELDNGLRVTLRPIAGSDTVAVLTLFDVGESIDPPGKSGLAHLVEHVYVTATPSTGQRSANEFMKAYPDGWNAQTGWDYKITLDVARRGPTAFLSTFGK